MPNPFRYFKSSPEVVRLAVMIYVRYPLSLRQVEELLFERGIDISHETVRFWWNRFGPISLPSCGNADSGGASTRSGAGISTRVCREAPASDVGAELHER
jgi:hypothetical protein